MLSIAEQQEWIDELTELDAAVAAVNAEYSTSLGAPLEEVKAIAGAFERAIAAHEAGLTFAQWRAAERQPKS